MSSHDMSLPINAEMYSGQKFGVIEDACFAICWSSRTLVPSRMPAALQYAGHRGR
jgi:hypothetical protein